MRSASLLAMVILAAGCGGGYGGGSVSGPPDPSDHRVDAVGVTSWSPTPVTVKAGEAVTFRNTSAITHNVQFDDVAGRPGNVADFTSASRSVTFTTAGTFAYHCGIHPAMQGQVVVEP